MAKLADIEGIGPVCAGKLKKGGVGSLESLLKQGGSKKGRTAISKASGCTEKQILKWVNRADLSRIKGVSTQYADLLECAGVDTVVELKNRNVENLQAKMAEVNAKKNLVRKVPGIKNVQSWVAQAKKLKRAVNY